MQGDDLSQKMRDFLAIDRSLPWEASEEELAQFDREMKARGVTLWRNENKGVTDKEADEALDLMLSSSAIKITSGLDDRYFGRKP